MVDGDSVDVAGKLAMLLAGFLKFMFLGGIAAGIASTVVSPMVLISRSSVYKMTIREGKPAVIAFFITAPAVLADIPNNIESVEFILQRFLLLDLKWLLRLGFFGFVRGGGKVGLGAVVLGALVSALGTLMYTFPLTKAEFEISISQGRYMDLVFFLKQKASKDGIISLFHGLGAVIPQAIVYSLILFMSIEILSNKLGNTVLYDIVVAVPVGLLAATIGSAPLEQLRKLLIAHPPDYDDMKPRMMVSYFKFIMDRWLGSGFRKVVGRVRLFDLVMLNTYMALSLFYIIIRRV